MFWSYNWLLLKAQRYILAVHIFFLLFLAGEISSLWFSTYSFIFLNLGFSFKKVLIPILKQSGLKTKALPAGYSRYDRIWCIPVFLSNILLLLLMTFILLLLFPHVLSFSKAKPLILEELLCSCLHCPTIYFWELAWVWLSFWGCTAHQPGRRNEGNKQSTLTFREDSLSGPQSLPSPTHSPYIFFLI